MENNINIKDYFDIKINDKNAVDLLFYLYNKKIINEEKTESILIDIINNLDYSYLFYILKSIKINGNENIRNIIDNAIIKTLKIENTTKFIFKFEYIISNLGYEMLYKYLAYKKIELYDFIYKYGITSTIITKILLILKIKKQSTNKFLIDIRDILIKRFKNKLIEGDDSIYTELLVINDIFIDVGIDTNEYLDNLFSYEKFSNDMFIDSFDNCIISYCRKDTINKLYNKALKNDKDLDEFIESRFITSYSFVLSFLKSDIIHSNEFKKYIVEINL